MSSALVALDSSALQMTDTAARLARSSSTRLVPLQVQVHAREGESREVLPRRALRAVRGEEVRVLMKTRRPVLSAGGQRIQYRDTR